MEMWQRMIRDSVHTVDQLVEKFNIDRNAAAVEYAKSKGIDLKTLGNSQPLVIDSTNN